MDLNFEYANITASFYIILVLVCPIAKASLTIGDRQLIQMNPSELSDDVSSGTTETSGSTDVCNPNPCTNDGLCKKKDSGYQCLCPNGFTGTKCDVELLDACHPNPCHNGGLCYAKTGTNSTLQCYCPSGFVGLKCERAIDICHPNPCFNDGECRKKGDTDYRCYCPPGHTGLKCEKSENYRCDFEHGFCGLFENGPKNTFNWTWREAATTREPKEDHTHKNAAGHFAYLDLRDMIQVRSSELSGPWLYSDHCIKFWYNFNLTPKGNAQLQHYAFFGVISIYSPSGQKTKQTFKMQSNGWQFYNFTEKCDENHKAFKIMFNVARYMVPSNGHVAIDDVEFIRGDCTSAAANDVCTPNPCYNGGLCEKRVGFNHDCYCPAGYTGANCDTESDPCRSYPCYYGSTCHKVDGVNFVCGCPSNATGERCEKQIGQICTTNPCKNGGVCHELKDGYRCDCPKWYSGKICAEDWWCVDGPGKSLCRDRACAFDHENKVGYCK